MVRIGRAEIGTFSPSFVQIIYMFRLREGYIGEGAFCEAISALPYAGFFGYFLAGARK